MKNFRVKQYFNSYPEKDTLYFTENGRCYTTEENARRAAGENGKVLIADRKTMAVKDIQKPAASAKKTAAPTVKLGTEETASEETAKTATAKPKSGKAADTAAKTKTPAKGKTVDSAPDPDPIEDEETTGPEPDADLDENPEDPE